VRCGDQVECLVGNPIFGPFRSLKKTKVCGKSFFAWICTTDFERGRAIVLFRSHVGQIIGL
jgi:hypothetical protein